MNFAEGVIFVATLLNSLLIIYNVTGKPFKFLKKKKNAEMQKKWKEHFMTYSAEVVKVLKPQLQEYVEDTIKDSVRPLEEGLAEIREIDMAQGRRIDEINEKIDLMDRGYKDMMRQRMMIIYHRNAPKREWDVYDKEAFDELYKDYTDDGGNSYITKYYERSRDWKVITKE